MSRLNKAKQNEVISYLNNKNFTLSDFEIEFPDQGDFYVSVVFRHDPKYYFRIGEEYSSLSAVIAISSGADRKAKPRTYEAPGEFKAKQIESCETFDDCILRIPIWCSNLSTELHASSPQLNELRELQEELETRFQQHIDDPESHFSPEELDRVYRTLDSLAEQIKTMEEDHAITKAQLNELISGIEGIKSNAASLPKGIWAGLTKNRLISLLKKIATSAEGRKLALEAAEKYLLGIKP